MPPRAKDSSLIERIKWRFSRSRSVAVAHERAQDASRAYKAEYERTSNTMPSPGYWLTTRVPLLWMIFPQNEEPPDMLRIRISRFRFEWLLQISVIPGFGYIFGRRDIITGCRHILAALCALLLAVVLYKTYIADALLCGILVMSIISGCVAINSIRPPEYYRSNDIFLLRYAFGTIVGPFITLFLCYQILTTCFVGPGLILAGNLVMPPPNAISRNDSLLLWNGNPFNDNTFSRGSIIVERMIDNQRSSGIIVGIPGDRVQVFPNGEMYLNGKALNITIQNLNMKTVKNSIQSYPDRIIPHGEFLVHRVIGDDYDHVRTPGTVSLDYVNRYFINGKVIAVTNPPAHRKIIRSYHQ